MCGLYSLRFYMVGKVVDALGDCGGRREILCLLIALTLVVNRMAAHGAKYQAHLKKFQ